MNAAPLLTQIAVALAKSGLEAVLIGNAAAALQGAPVTTMDFDFMFRATPANLQKLKAFAAALDAIVLRPYYPASGLYRVMNDDSGLQVDFRSNVHSVKSFAGLHSRAHVTELAGCRVLVASLSDIIESKKAADRPRDRAVLEVLEKTLRESEKGKKGRRSPAGKGSGVDGADSPAARAADRTISRVSATYASTAPPLPSRLATLVQPRTALSCRNRFTTLCVRRSPLREALVPQPKTEHFRTKRGWGYKSDA